MAHVLNAFSFYDHWSALIPDCVADDTANEITNCMAAIWLYLYQNSEAFEAGESPINCDIKINSRDISMAASAVMADCDIFVFMGDSCNLKQMHELTRRFTTMIFQLCLCVEQSLDNEANEKEHGTGVEDISFDF